MTLRSFNEKNESVTWGAIVFNKLKYLFCFGLLLASPAYAQRGALTVSRNLAELVAQADRIVLGRVLVARVERHPQLTNLHTVVVTLRVEETLKGKAQKTLTFRQFIWDIRDRLDAARYLKGQRVLLLLNPVTKLGLTSPAGLEQGRFRLIRDAAGNEYAVNGHNNGGLFRNLTSYAKEKGIPLDSALVSFLETRRTGPIPLADMKNFIRQLRGFH